MNEFLMSHYDRFEYCVKINTFNAFLLNMIIVIYLK